MDPFWILNFVFVNVFIVISNTIISPFLLNSVFPWNILRILLLRTPTFLQLFHSSAFTFIFHSKSSIWIRQCSIKTWYGASDSQISDDAGISNTNHLIIPLSCQQLDQSHFFVFPSICQLLIIFFTWRVRKIFRQLKFKHLHIATPRTLSLHSILAQCDSVSLKVNYLYPNMFHHALICWDQFSMSLFVSIPQFRTPSSLHSPLSPQLDPASLLVPSFHLISLLDRNSFSRFPPPQPISSSSWSGSRERFECLIWTSWPFLLRALPRLAFYPIVSSCSFLEIPFNFRTISFITIRGGSSGPYNSSERETHAQKCGRTPAELWPLPLSLNP